MRLMITDFSGTVRPSRGYAAVHHLNPQPGGIRPEGGNIMARLRLRGLVGSIVLVSAPLLMVACDRATSGSSEDPSCSGAKVPSLVNAAPNATMNRMFSSYGDHSTPQDWSGADGGRSISMPDGRSLWTYGDSFLGPVNPDHTRPRGVAVLTNSFIVQDGERLSTIYTHSTPPGAAIPVQGHDPHERWYWPGPGTIGNGEVEILLSQVRRSRDSGGFGFTGEKQVLARLSLPDLRLIGLTDLPNTVPGLYGSSAVPVGSMIMIV